MENANVSIVKKSTHVKMIKTIMQTLKYVFCFLMVIICLLPFVILFVNATRSTVEIQGKVSLIPSIYLISNWNILVGKGFNVLAAMGNSLFVSVCSTLLCVYFSTLTAYGFRVYRFKGKKILFALVLGIIMVPGQLGMIGFYQFMLKLSLTDSFIPLIIPSIASATTVFFMTQYLEANYVDDITQAARIDGAGEFRIFHTIGIPLLLPGMATMCIFSMIGSWNNYVMPLILISDQGKYTLPMLVQLLKTDIYKTEYGALYLGIALTILPLVVVYFVFSKFIISGVALGGVKG